MTKATQWPQNTTRQPHWRTHRLLLRIALPEMVDEILDFRIRNREFLQPWLPLQNEFAFDRKFNQSFLRNERNDWLEGRFLSIHGQSSGKA